MAIISTCGHFGLNIAIHFKLLNYTSNVYYKVNLAINRRSHSQISLTEPHFEENIHTLSK